jgi:uncharacterized membrane protein YqjE
VIPQDDSGAGEPPRGLLDSLRGLATTLIAIGHNRLELLSVEVQEEVERVASLLVWSIGALLLGVAALLLLAVAVVLSVDPRWRWVAAGGLGVLFLVGCWAAARRARSRLYRKPRPFDATLSELHKDHDLLKR